MADDHAFVSEHSSLDYGKVYPCPICQQGELSAITLMEAMGCNVCRHIFTIDPVQQHLQVADNLQTLRWAWTGRRWQRAGYSTSQITAYVWLLAVLLVFLPSGIVAIGAYMFPTFPDDPLGWLPWTWVILTFATHLVLFTWGLLEYYQVPLYLSVRFRLQRFVNFIVG